MVEIAATERPNDTGKPSSDARTGAKLREPLWRHMLGDSLRERRNDLGQTLDEIATRAGVSPQYLSEVERGLKEPSSEIIAAGSGALGTTLLDLTIDVARSLSVVSPPAAEVSASQANFALTA